MAGEGHGRAEGQEVARNLAQGQAAAHHHGDADRRQRHYPPGSPRDAFPQDGLGTDGREKGGDATHEGGVRHRDATERQDEQDRGRARAEARQDRRPAGEPDRPGDLPPVDDCDHGPDHRGGADRAIQDDVPARRLLDEPDQEAGQAPEERGPEGEREAADAARPSGFARRRWDPALRWGGRAGGLSHRGGGATRGHGNTGRTPVHAPAECSAPLIETPVQAALGSQSCSGPIRCVLVS